MRRNRFFALVVSAVALGVGAGPAMADARASGQLSEQIAGNEQSAQSGATSTQYGPSNTNISVRVLSPGDNGSVTQRNTLHRRVLRRQWQLDRAGGRAAAVRFRGRPGCRRPVRRPSTISRRTHRRTPRRSSRPIATSRCGFSALATTGTSPRATTRPQSRTRSTRTSSGRRSRQAQYGSRCCSHEGAPKKEPPRKEHGDHGQGRRLLSRLPGHPGSRTAGVLDSRAPSPRPSRSRYKPENNERCPCAC